MSILTSTLGKLGWSSHINTQNWTVSYDAPSTPPAQADVVTFTIFGMGTLENPGAEPNWRYNCSHPGDQSGDYIRTDAAPQQQADGREIDALVMAARYIMENWDDASVDAEAFIAWMDTNGSFALRAALAELDGPK